MTSDTLKKPAPKHYKRFTMRELIFICSADDYGHTKDVARVLQRSESSIHQIRFKLRNRGEYDYYVSLGGEPKWNRQLLPLLQQMRNPPK